MTTPKLRAVESTYIFSFPMANQSPHCPCPLCSLALTLRYCYNLLNGLSAAVLGTALHTGHLLLIISSPQLPLHRHRNTRRGGTHLNSTAGGSQAGLGNQCRHSGPILITTKPHGFPNPSARWRGLILLSDLAVLLLEVMKYD